MTMKSERIKTKTQINSIFFFYRSETNVKNPTQIREKVPVRENIHSEPVLNLYPVDTSTLVTGSQDRV